MKHKFINNITLPSTITLPLPTAPKSLKCISQLNISTIKKSDENTKLYIDDTFIEVPSYFLLFNVKYYEPEIIQNGAGTFGQIIIYKDDKQRSFVIKNGTVDDIKNDIAVINKIKNKNIIVESYVFSDTIILMETAAGTCSDFVPIIKRLLKKDSMYGTKHGIHLIIAILYQVSYAFKCLHNDGLFYTDAKLANILYKYADNDADRSIQIILGDLGSACLHNQELTRTYDAIERLKYNKSLYPTEGDIVWGIGMILVELIVGNKLFKLYKKTKTGAGAKIEGFLGRLFYSMFICNNGFGDLLEIFKGTLNIDPTKRWTLDMTVDTICKKLNC